MDNIAQIMIGSSGAGIAFLIAIAMLSRRKLSLTFLGIVFLSLFLILAEDLLWSSELIYTYVHGANFSESINFVIVPSLYLYATYQFKHNFEWKDLLHFLPALLVIVNFMPFYLSSPELKSCYIIEEIIDSETAECNRLLSSHTLFFLKEAFTDILHIIQFILYGILIFPLFKKISASKTKKVQNQFLSWTKILIILILAAILIIILDVFVLTESNLIIFFISIATALIGYKLLIESSLIQDNFITNNYSNVIKEDIDNIIEKARAFLIEETSFQDPNMSVEKLAKNLDLPRNKLMHVMRESNMNFREELNKLRIDKAKALLKNNTMLTIEAIGNEVGYSSKATFYKYFKKYEGVTPNLYLSSIRHN